MVFQKLHFYWFHVFFIFAMFTLFYVISLNSGKSTLFDFRILTNGFETLYGQRCRRVNGEAIGQKFSLSNVPSYVLLPPASSFTSRLEAAGLSIKILCSFCGLLSQILLMWIFFRIYWLILRRILSSWPTLAWPALSVSQYVLIHTK